MDSLRELRREMANAITHGLGILFGIASIPLLSAIGAKTCNVPGVVGATIYAFSFLMLFSFSTLYHSTQNIAAKRILRTFDHISIYFLIAGTYTPFLLMYMLDGFGITLLSIQWSLVLFGIIFKVFFTGRLKVVSTIIYIAMGWLLLVGGKRFFEELPTPVLVLVIIGGGLYTLGSIFYLNKKIYHHHAIWHLFVLSAAICHYVAVLVAVIITGQSGCV
ncbi:MAG: hemolysin III family protein [Fibromonadaceae bacterium]|jgi:hemolysin III|nr:hemolysin III family protein [Fibromonadaceae bacterium]